MSTAQFSGKFVEIHSSHNGNMLFTPFADPDISPAFFAHVYVVYSEAGIDQRQLKLNINLHRAFPWCETWRVTNL